MADRATVLAEHGLDGFFGLLHRDLALRDGSLERSARALTRAGMPVRYRLGGQGLQIIPSILWSGPPLFSIGLPGPVVSTMVYPARHPPVPEAGPRYRWIVIVGVLQDLAMCFAIIPPYIAHMCLFSHDQTQQPPDPPQRGTLRWRLSAAVP